MKKRWIWLVLLALALTAAAAQADGGAASYAGEWELRAVLIDGKEYSPAVFGLTEKLTLEEAGTAQLDNSGRSEKGSWTADGEGVATDFERSGAMRFAPRGNELVVVQQGLSLVFARAGAQAGPAALSEEDVALYGGEWVLTKVMGGGETYDPAEAGIMATLTLNADGTASMDTVDAVENGTWTRGGEGITLDLELSGAYLFVPQGEELFFDVPDLGMSMTFARPAAEPEPEPQAFAGGTFVCTEAVLSGVTVDLSALGSEFSADLRADGSAVLVLAGGRIEGLAWTETDGDILMPFYGTRQLRFVRSGDGFALEYSSGVLLLFKPE